MNSAMSYEQFVAANPDIADKAFTQISDSVYQHKTASNYVNNPNGIFNRLGGFLSGANKAYRNAYDAYLMDYQNKYTASREDSALLRNLNQIKEAGLNPYLLINNGSVTSAGSAGSTAYKQSKEADEDSAALDLLGSAFKILLLMALK